MSLGFSGKDVGIEGVVVSTVPVHQDLRGEFVETQGTYPWFKLADEDTVKQVNVIHSRAGVLRGAHVSMEKQIKEVKVLSGIVDQVLVDCRLYSPTFGEEIVIRHDATDRGGDMLVVLVPPHVANAIISVTDATILYTTNMEYKPQFELGVRVSAAHYKGNDVSEKDSNAMDVHTVGGRIFEYNNR